MEAMAATSRGVLGAHAGMLAWAVIVGFSFPAVALLSDGLPPLTSTSLRFGIAAAAMVPFVAGRPGPWPSPRAMPLYAVMGLSLAAFFGAMFWAARHATALSMATLYVSVPLLTYLLGRAFGVERPARALVGILLLGAAGAIGLHLAETRDGGPGPAFGFGEAVFLAGCVGSALYPVLSRWGLERGWLESRPEVRTLWSMLAGAATVGVIALLTESPRPADIGPRDLLVLVYLGVFSTGITFWLMQRATAVLTPAAVTAYSYLAPLASMLLLFVLQPQQISLRWLPGSLLVLLAIALLLRRDANGRKDAFPRRRATSDITSTHGDDR